MKEDYRDKGIETYGHACELCGYRASVEVHHISYVEHNDYEVKLRKAMKAGEDLSKMLEECEEQGYMNWDGHDLDKDNRTTNLSVLCSNCHTLVHTVDMGKSVLRALGKRV